MQSANPSTDRPLFHLQGFGSGGLRPEMCNELFEGSVHKSPPLNKGMPLC